MSGQSRQASISLIRFTSLLLIITCHIMQWYEIELAWWLNVGVQIFLCISGYLYGQKDLEELTHFYSRRFKKILIPYYLVFIPYGILQFIFAKDIFKPMSFMRGLFVNATLTGAGHLWFVATILLCYVLTPLLAAYRNRFVDDKKGLWCFTISAVFITTLFFVAFNDFYNAAWISCYVIGYALGINAKKQQINDKTLIALTGIVAILGNGAQIYFDYIANRHFKGWSLFCDYNHVALGIFLFLALKYILDKKELSQLTGLLAVADAYSYEVYLVHHLVILGPFSMLALIGIIPLNILLILLVTSVLAFILKKIEQMVFRN